jgi:hypothetical protein
MLRRSQRPGTKTPRDAQGARILWSRKTILLSVAAAAVLIVVAVVADLSLLAGDSSAKGAPVGVQAPDFSRHSFGPGRAAVKLSAFRGHAVLLSFLNTQAEATVAGDPSRAQIVFLHSMDTQNNQYGLRTIVIDAANTAKVDQPSNDALINYGYDCSLPNSITVIDDPDGSIARDYGVTKVPMTVLIDRQGIVNQRWSSLALAAQLDFAIRPLLGRTIFEAPNTTSTKK